ncbi:magnesium transporter [Candidatus Woesearchaeota archaeon]|nr:magnesium transporter [Candidatus Woesearchaeota archaeon]
MKGIKEHLEKLRKIKREKYHPLIHKIHKKHKISKKTLFYIKEYGPHTNIAKTIIKESIKILIFASLLSSFGGLAIESIKNLFVTIIPFIILFPILNDTIGGYGGIISSRFSTMLHENKVKKNWWKNKDIRSLFIEIFIIAIIITSMSVFLSLIVSYFFNYPIDSLLIFKVFLITILDVILLIIILFFVSIFAGIYYYKKKEDPNNFLIPITTSIADFGNMVILAVLIIIFF